MQTIATHEEYFRALGEVAGCTPLSALEVISRHLLEASISGRCLYLLGNGGSAALASHMACDLGKGTVVPGQPRLRVVALTDNAALLTAWANDVNYECVFAEQLAGQARPGDLVLAISGSGNSPNVLAALAWARAHGCITLGLAGFQGGKMKDLCDVCWVVPSDNMQLIEDLHVSASHSLFTVLRHRMLAAPAKGMAAAV